MGVSAATATTPLPLLSRLCNLMLNLGDVLYGLSLAFPAALFSFFLCTSIGSPNTIIIGGLLLYTGVSLLALLSSLCLIVFGY